MRMLMQKCAWPECREDAVYIVGTLHPDEQHGFVERRLCEEHSQVVIDATIRAMDAGSTSLVGFELRPYPITRLA